MQLLKNGTMALIASIFFQPQITCILWRNCLLRGVFQKNFHSQKKFMLIGRRGNQKSNVMGYFSGSFTIHILSLVFSVEGLYDHTQQLQTKVRNTLGGSSDKEQRQKLKLQLLELSSLKQLSAKGYFSVSKETLTSMLSVR